MLPAMLPAMPSRFGRLFAKPASRDDARGGRFVVVIECLLNQNARDRGAAAYSAVNDAVVALCVRHGVGLLQLPCPEIRFLGPDRARPPGVRIRDRLDTPAGRQCCREISDEVVDRVHGYLEHGVELVAILGGNPESPGCAVHPVASGAEAPDARSGILMQTLAEALEAASIRVPFRGIRDCRPEWLEADLRWLEERFRP